MRLLRPPARSGWITTGAWAIASATSRATRMDGSSAITEYMLLDVTPACAGHIPGAWRVHARRGEQDPLDLVWEGRVVQHLLEIIDKVRTMQAGDPRELLLARILEIDVLGRYAESGFVEETPRSHPSQRGAAQAYAGRVVVAELCLVAHDHQRAPLAPAAPQKGIDA